MEKYNKLLRNITELIEKGLFSSKDLKKEVEDSLNLKMEVIANTNIVMNLRTLLLLQRLVEVKIMEINNK